MDIGNHLQLKAELYINDAGIEIFEIHILQSHLFLILRRAAHCQSRVSASRILLVHLSPLCELIITVICEWVCIHVVGGTWLVSLHNGGDTHPDWETHYSRTMAAGVLSCKVHLSDVYSYTHIHFNHRHCLMSECCGCMPPHSTALILNSK